MSDSSSDEKQTENNLNAGNELQRALMRLTSPQVEEIQQELTQLKKQIDDLKKLKGDTSELQKKLNDVSLSIQDIETRSIQLGNEIRDPVMIGQRLETTVVPALYKQVNSHGDDVADALAPVIGPAIRRQIRDAKDDIIDALYPLIGQIIGKAISEALRELTRNIDARLRKQLNFRDRINGSIARLRGVSEAELLLRGSLPYSIERAFLIHKETGLLLTHLSPESDARMEVNTISGMLTAIQDFVRDSFSGGEGDLEEITHGGRRILLEGGRYTYVAVVLNGVEPEGYNLLIQDVVSYINIQHEKELKEFDGSMQGLPDFRKDLTPLLEPGPLLAEQSNRAKPLSGPQKRLVGLSLIGLLVLIGLSIFACVFVIKLWPVAFPGNMASPTMTLTSIPSFTPTPLPTLTPTIVLPTHTLIPTPTKTSTVQPPSPSPSPVVIGILSGNLNVRTEPSSGSLPLGIVFAREKVVIWEQQGNWYLITWPVDGDPKLKGWINGERYLDLP